MAVAVYWLHWIWITSFARFRNTFIQLCFNFQIKNGSPKDYDESIRTYIPDDLSDSEGNISHFEDSDIFIVIQQIPIKIAMVLRDLLSMQNVKQWCKIDMKNLCLISV